MSAHPSEPTSLSLLQNARLNDPDAWSRIVRLYGPLVHKWCKRAGLPDEDTADVFQETFRSVSGSLERFSPSKSIGSFRSWLRTIARTKIADHFRRLQKQPPGQGGTHAQLIISNIVDPVASDEDEETDEDDASIIHETLEMIRPEFSEKNWRAFQMVALEGQSASDVARLLEVNPQAVRQANYRIRRRLRTVLQGLVEDLPLE